MKKRSKVKGATITKLFLLVAMMGVIFTGCKDYDDDIDSLQTDVTALESSYNDMKSAQDALSAKVTTLESAVQNATDATARQNAQNALEKANDALTKINKIVSDIEALQTGKVSKADYDAAVKSINDRIDAITPTLNVLIGQVTSLEFIPDNVINGVTPIIYGITLNDGSKQIPGTVTLRYRVNPKSAKYVNVVGLVKQTAKTRAAEVTTDITPMSYTVEDGIITVKVKSTDFESPKSGTQNTYALVVDNSTEGAESRYVYSDYVTTKIDNATSPLSVTSDPSSFEVVYNNSVPVRLTPIVNSDSFVLNGEGFDMEYTFTVDDAGKDYFSVDNSGLVTVKNGYAAVGKTATVTVKLVKVNGVTLSSVNQPTTTVTVNAVASAPTEGELGTVTKEFIYGSKATFEEKVFDITNFANATSRPTSDFTSTSNFTDVVKDAEGNTISGNAITLSIIGNDVKINVNPDGTPSLNLDKVYTLKRTYSFDSGRVKYVATVNVKVKTPTFVSNRIDSYWNGNILKTQGRIVSSTWEMSTDLKNAYKTGPIQIVGSTTSIFTANDMTFKENPNDDNVRIAGSVISLDVSGTTDADIQKYLNGSKKSNIDVKVTKNGRNLTLESIQVQFASPLTITVTPVSFNAADGHPDKVWSQVITIKGIANDSNLKVTPATETEPVKYEVDGTFLTRYNIAIGDINTGNPNLTIDWNKTNNEWIKYNNTIPLANDLTATYDVVVKFGDSQKYSQTAQLPVTVKK